MDVKVTLFFNENSQGWTENYYQTGAANYADVARLLTLPATGLFNVRASLLPTGARIFSARIANVDAVRDGFPVLAGASGSGNFRLTGRTVPEDFEPVDVACLIRAFVSPSQWRTLVLRGLPKNVVDAFGTAFLPNNWLDLLKNFTDALKANRWCMRTSTRQASVGLTAVTLQDGAVYSLTTDAAITNFAPGDTIVVYGAKGMSNVNGRYRVKESLAGNVYTVAKRLKRTVGALTAGTGRVADIKFSYNAFTNFAAPRVGNRQTGRPSDAPRGRALVQRG